MVSYPFSETRLIAAAACGQLQEVLHAHARTEAYYQALRWDRIFGISSIHALFPLHVRMRHPSMVASLIRESS